MIVTNAWRVDGIVKRMLTVILTAFGEFKQVTSKQKQTVTADENL